MAGLLTDSSLQTPSHLFEAVAAFACPEFWKSQQRVLLPMCAAFPIETFLLP